MIIINEIQLGATASEQPVKIGIIRQQASHLKDLSTKNNITLF